MDIQFTTKSQDALGAAVRIAAANGNPQVEPLHLLDALLQQGEGIATALLSAVGVDVAALTHQVRASLSSLRRLPLDQIKIARSLLPGLLADPNSAAIIKTIISIGRDMGLEVLATSVETEQQRDLLLDLGCSLWQGDLFGQPQQVDDFNLLRQAA